MSFAIQRVAFLTIARKEVGRVIRIWTQTILPPVITQSLYFVIFGNLLGQRIGEVGGLSYAAFLVPGLVLMAVVTNAFSNVSSSFFVAKFQKSIEELLVAPVAPGAMLGGYVLGGVVRSVIVSAVVFFVSMWFVTPTMVHPWAVVYFGLMTGIFFALLGFLNGMFARKFDDIAIVPTFVLTPLTYLGGVFYDISNLPGVWQTVAKFNPLAYAIDGFRFGFSGVASTPVAGSAAVLGLVTLALGGWIYVMLKKRVGLQS
ncbi:ABC transporter permease [bacterium]|nr:ABC transporter permease [bacterium]